LIIIDILRQGKITVNNKEFELENIYFSSINQNNFNFDYEILVEPILELLKINKIYQVILIVSFYSNLGFGAYEAAEGYEGSAEDVKLEFLEYMVTVNVQVIKEIESVLLKFIPEINSGDEINYDKKRKFKISDVALELIKLEKSGLSSISKISLPGLIYGIFIGKIKSEDLSDINLKQKIRVNSNYEDIFEEFASFLFHMRFEIDKIDYDPIFRTILNNSIYSVYGESKVDLINSSEYLTFIDLLILILDISQKEKSRNIEFQEEITTIMHDFISHLQNETIRTRYIDALKIHGIDTSNYLRIDNDINDKNNNKKSNWFSKLKGNFK
jgi:CTP-dependent riboflavin kinase